jgi:site-specific recombinase XerD
MTKERRAYMSFTYQELMKEFSNWLLYQNKKTRTIDEYLHTVKSFLVWVQEEYKALSNPSEITTKHVSQWKTYLRNYNLAPTTIHKKLAALKTYWNFMELAGYSANNPMKKIGLPRSLSSSEYFLYLSDDEEDSLLAEVKKEKNEWKRIRNISIIMMMLVLGLRVSEIIQLKRKDLFIERQLLLVYNDDENVRKLTISPVLADLLSNWLWISDPPSYLFPSSHEGGPLTRQALHYIVKKYCRSSGNPQHSAQTLRNTFIKRCLDKDMDLVTLAKLLGLKGTESIQKFKRK